MSKALLYHNPRWGKSREAVKLLDDNNIDYNIVEYLKEPLSIDEILDIEDPFESLEPILPEEVYPIMVLAMINNIRSDTVMDALTEGFQKGVIQYKKVNNA